MKLFAQHLLDKLGGGQLLHRGKIHLEQFLHPHGVQLSEKLAGAEGFLPGFGGDGIRAEGVHSAGIGRIGGPGDHRPVADVYPIEDPQRHRAGVVRYAVLIGGESVELHRLLLRVVILE